MYAFVHIEKAAGTTLIHILRRNFFMQYADVRPLSQSSQSIFNGKDLKSYLKLNPFIECIGGHSVVPYNGLDEVCVDIQYFTVLRDPIKRYLSQYEYTVHNRGRNMSFEQFLEWESLWNLQTTKIAGVPDAQKAIDILNEKFLVVGTVDQFDLFLATLKQAVNNKSLDVSYDEKNIGVKGNRGTNYEQYKDRILENNKQDVLLYDYCKNVLIPSQSKHFFGDEHFRPSQAQVGTSLLSKLKSYSDYVFRKAYLEPVTGGIRKRSGLSPYGSY